MSIAFGTQIQASEITKVYAHLASAGSAKEVGVLGPDFSDRQRRTSLERPSVALGNQIGNWRANPLTQPRLTVIKTEGAGYRVVQEAETGRTRFHRLALYRVDFEKDEPQFTLLSPQVANRGPARQDAFMGRASFPIGAGHLLFMNPFHLAEFETHAGSRAGFLAHALTLTLPPPEPKTEIDVHRDLIFTILSRMPFETLRQVATNLGYTITADHDNRAEFIQRIMQEKTQNEAGISAVSAAIHAFMPRTKNILSYFGITSFNSAAL